MLSEKRRTTTSKLVEQLAQLCSIYNVASRSLAEKHEIGSGENQIEKVDFRSPGYPYKVRPNGNADHANIDVVDLKDMKEMARVLGKGMKPVAYQYVFNSAPRFTFRTGLLLSKKERRS